MPFAFDGASMFDLAAAKSAGGIVCSVYIVGSPGGMPHADKARVDAIRAAGMGALPNWERAADFFLTCSVADAKAAGAEALAACKALGFPADGSVRVAFSADCNVPKSRFAEIGQKVDAVKAGLTDAYQVMLYAQSDLIDWLVANGHLTGKHWLMASTWGNPYDAGSPNVCMVQSHDAAGNWLSSHVGGTDINTITDPHAIGAWWPDGSSYGTVDPWEQIMSFYASKADFETAMQRITNNPQWNTSSGPHSPDTVVRAAVGDHVDSQVAALQSQVAALQAAVTKLATGGVDPVAVAQAIAAHVKLTAQ